MPNRKRWYAELAGTILMWAEEVDDNPPWNAYILRRPMAGAMATPEGELVPVQIPATRESFVARDERIAMDACETTIKHDPAYSEYAPRLPELNWQECEVSDDEWNARCARFVAVKHP
jgi:hypothetical protein